MPQAHQEVKYFNLHTSGLGYLLRIRHIDVRDGTTINPPILTCASLIRFADAYLIFLLLIKRSQIVAENNYAPAEASKFR